MNIETQNQIRTILTSALHEIETRDHDYMLGREFPMSCLDENETITTIENIGREMGLLVHEWSETDTHLGLAIERYPH